MLPSDIVDILQERGEVSRGAEWRTEGEVSRGAEIQFLRKELD